MIEIIDKGILYRNPLPQLRVVHACFPVIQELSEQEFLCVYRRGTAFESADARIAKLRSVDGGRTWTEEGVVYDGSKDDRPYCYRGGAVTKLSDGTLLIVSTRWDRFDPDKPLYSPQTEGYLPSQTVLFRSSDLGHSWSGLQVVPLPDGLLGNYSGPIIELADGRFLLPFETWKNYDDISVPKQRAMLLFSENKGKTWGNPVIVGDGVSDGVYYWDQRIISLGGLRLFVMFWVHDIKTDKDLPIHYAVSEDGGKVWSKPKSTGINGQVVCPVNLGKGKILAVYNLRYAENPGIISVISNDEGKTWDFNNQVLIWDATSQANVGIKARERSVADMSTFGFGKPNAEKLINGDVLASFWCTQNCVTHIRWCRIRI